MAISATVISSEDYKLGSYRELLNYTLAATRYVRHIAVF